MGTPGAPLEEANMNDWVGLTRVVAVLIALVPGALWCAWWLWGVSWRKTWPILAAGGWAPVVLLSLLATVVWTVLDPAACTCLGFVTLPSFWGHLGSVLLLVLAALLCGWLQGKFGWAPGESEPARKVS
jgi:hypothetical protein